MARSSRRDSDQPPVTPPGVLPLNATGKDILSLENTRIPSRKQIVDMLRKNGNLEHLDLRGADLSGVSFDGAKLRWIKLAEANLARCSFRGADLSGASMWNANLKDACFDDAILEDADLDCANIDGCSFKNARIRKTIFPTPRLSLHQVQDSLRTGAKIKLEKKSQDDDR